MPRSLPIALITAAYTLVWLSIESCVVYVLGAGLAARSDRSVAIAGAVVARESMIFAANGFRCPLTISPSPAAPTRARSPAFTCRRGSPQPPGNPPADHPSGHRAAPPKRAAPPFGADPRHLRRGAA
jgi:hypothetical protein